MADAFKLADDLTQFTDWWMKTRAVKPPVDGFHRVSGAACTVLFREGKFQVQMFACDPGTEIADHRHPNVRSFVMYVTGDVFFRKNGEVVVTPEMIEARAAAGTPLVGLIGRVDQGDWHGATIGPRGGVFIGIEEWMNGAEPTSVHLDWEGPALDDAHAKALAKG